MTNLLSGVTLTVGSTGVAPVAGCGTFTPATPANATDGNPGTYSLLCNGLTSSAGPRTGFWIGDLGAAYTLTESTVRTQGNTSGSGSGSVAVYGSNGGTGGPWTLLATHGYLTSAADAIPDVQALAGTYRYVKLEWSWTAGEGFVGYTGMRLAEWTIDGAAVPAAVGWDVYAAADPNGPKLATLTTAKDRSVRVELNGAGTGRFTINRHDAQATEAVLAKGNIIKVRIPELGDDYFFASVARHERRRQARLGVAPTATVQVATPHRDLAPIPGAGIPAVRPIVTKEVLLRLDGRATLSTPAIIDSGAAHSVYPFALLEAFGFRWEDLEPQEPGWSFAGRVERRLLHGATLEVDGVPIQSPVAVVESPAIRRALYPILGLDFFMHFSIGFQLWRDPPTVLVRPRPR